MATYSERQQEAALRDEVVRVCRLLWEKGFVAASDGNVSVRLGKDHLLTTPTGMSKGFVSATDVVLCTLDGKPVRSFERGSKVCGVLPSSGQGRPSSEILLHLEVYQQRPDVRAVVHAHPPLAIAFTIAGISLAQCVLPEVVVNLGQVPTTAYATPASPEGPVVVRELIRNHDALIIDRHGTVTVGPTLFDAYMKLEKVEHLAQVTLAARQLGRVSLIPPEEMRKLVEIRRTALGLPPDYQGPGCVQCGACGREAANETAASLAAVLGVPPASAGEVSEEDLVRRIVERVTRELQQHRYSIPPRRD